MVENGQNDRFGQNDLIPNWILAFARLTWINMVHFGPFWTEEVYFGPFRSANRTLATPDLSKVQNKGTQGVQARCGTELPPFISIVRCPRA